MVISLQQARFIQGFTCLGDACADTCCKGWGMQVSEKTVALYREQAPELLDAVTSGESEHIMRRDPNTDYCVKFEGGWCGVHKQYGTDFLGDACHFYPRITRALGSDVAVMSASLSCPEIARLALFADAPSGYSTQDGNHRLPHSLKHYLPEGLTPEQALTIHQAFMNTVMDASIPPERGLLRVAAVANSLEMLPVASWPDAVPFYLNQADSRIPAAEPHIADAFNLLNILIALLGAAKATPRPRLEQTITDMATALAVTIDRAQGTLTTSEASLSNWQAMTLRWQEEYANAMALILRRWCMAQLSAAFFPFSAAGGKFSEQATMLLGRFATVKLALMSLCHVTGCQPSETEVIRVVQSLSRFMDHLAEVETSLTLYHQVGFTSLARLRGVAEMNSVRS
jgi:lysine-N-methylase